MGRKLGFGFRRGLILYYIDYQSTYKRQKLVGTVGRWNDLPVNKRLRKRFEKNGLMVHFFAGPDEGMTLRKAMQEQGEPIEEPIEKLLELDILRGSTHDVLSEETYGGFLRACFEAQDTFQSKDKPISYVL